MRLAHSADLRSRLRHVSSAPSVAYSTGCSRVVTHPGTNPARRCLTCFHHLQINERYEQVSLFSFFETLFIYKWRTRMEPRRPPVCKILLPRWYYAPRLPSVLAGHKTNAPCVIDAYVAFLSRLLVLVVFFPMGTSAWQCFV